jgi:hypothetical protein
MNKAWLLAVLVLSGCSTITTEAPKDLSQFAEVDAVVTNDVPEVTIYGIAAYTGPSSRYFFTGIDQKGPTKVFLSPGAYLVTVSCYGVIYLAMDDIAPSGPPRLKVTVDAGKKYWLGCKKVKKDEQIYSDEIYLDEQ